MRNLILRLFVGTVVLVGTTGAYASDCDFPQSPSMPDGTSASQEEMASASTAVRDYVSNAQAALECLETAEANLGAEITPEQKSALTAQYNQGVDELNAVAADYNAQVKAFKSRQD